MKLKRNDEVKDEIKILTARDCVTESTFSIGQTRTFHLQMKLNFLCAREKGEESTTRNSFTGFLAKLQQNILFNHLTRVPIVTDTTYRRFISVIDFYGSELQRTLPRVKI